MKTFTLLLGFIFSLSFSVLGQLSGPEITFEKTIHDFGSMKQHTPTTYEFKFTNTGNAPLIISNAEGTCGCTIPTWPQHPIAPGASAVIVVKYDSKRVGPFKKSVKITSNASSSPNIELRIQGTIIAQ
ncbi:DUF1573 domain-containing protein [bacterium SCSIO 12643]|nr:DUF1573 domain-containing protein [bacterium SCSIO 12643]